MKFNKLLLLLSFFATSIPTLWAQDTAFAKISGRVISDQGNPLPGAYIFINDFQHGAVSDSAGYYSKTVEAGKNINLYVVFIGYDTSVMTIKLKPNQQKNLNFQLTGQFISFSTSGISKITFETENWEEIFNDTGYLEFFENPKTLM